MAILNTIKGRLRFSIIASLFAVTLAAFLFKISGLFLLTVLLFGFASLVFLVSVILSLICLTEFSSIKMYAFIPLLINVAAVIIIFTVPFNKLWAEFDFFRHKEEWTETVSKINRGKLHLTENAYPVVEMYDNKKYFFFIISGNIDGYSGFLYVPKGGNPRKFPGIYKVTYFGDNWYFTESY